LQIAVYNFVRLEVQEVDDVPASFQGSTKGQPGDVGRPGGRLVEGGVVVSMGHDIFKWTGILSRLQVFEAKHATVREGDEAAIWRP
jgi:hypothetical protein